MPKNLQSYWYKLIIKLFVIACVVMGAESLAAPSVEGIQIYHKNLHLWPEHKQKLADDITRYRNADNLWDALREEFNLPHYENSPAVQEKIEWFMNNQDFLLRSASRSAPYLYYILQQVKKRHLPAELVLLPIIESGYNPFNRSPVGAVGIWQLMPDTATGLGVKRDWLYDGRRDVIASTRAALNYLAYLQSFFEGNWLLAIAAYNTGEGNVLAAIKRNIRDGKDTDFWSLPVAQQTKDYVPSLLALATIISHPDQYPIYFPPVRNAPYLAQVDTGTQINLKYAAKLAGISHTKLMQLNPGFTQHATSTKGAYKLVLPIENVEQFSENLANSPMRTQTPNWIHYKVKSGDTVATIAKKFGITPTELRNLNRLSKNGLRHGASILIPSNEKTLDYDDEMPTAVADNSDDDDQPKLKASSKYLAEIVKKKITSEPVRIVSSESYANYTLQPGDTVYMVRKKDSVSSIANRFHVDPEALREANKLSSTILQPGRQIIIPTHKPRTENAYAGNSSEQNLAPGDTIYMIRRGDTIEKIASKFKTTPSAIRLTNLLDSNTLQEGEQLIIPTHQLG